MVGQQNAIHTLIGTPLGVLPALHALNDDLPVPDSSEPGKVMPGQVIRDVAAHQPTYPTAALIVRRLGTGHWRGQTLVRLDPLVCLALAGHRGVDGNEDGVDAQGADLLKQYLRLGTVLVDVQLEEERVLRVFRH